MLVLASLLGALATVLNSIFYFLTILVTVRVVLSWVNADPYNPVVRFIIASTEPLFALLGPLRRKINSIGGGRIDWSPLLLLLIIVFLQHFLVQLLMDYSVMIRTSSFQSAH